MALIDKETIYSEIEARREHMVYELYGLEENTLEYQRLKGMHDAYVDMLTYLTYSLPKQPKLKRMNIPSGGGAMGTTPPSYKLEVKKQPVIKKSNALFEECLANVDPAIRKEVSDNIDKMLGRQPVEGLEEEMEKFFETMPVLEHENIFEDTFKNIARHFAEWGMNYMPLPEDTTIFQKGVAEGKRLIMENAVDGRYMKAYSKVYVESWPLDIEPDSVKAGDEVRLIVIPEKREKVK